MRAKVISALALVALTLPCVCAAAMGLGDDEEKQLYTDAYASCMVDINHQRAAEIILKDVSDQAFITKYQDIFIDKALNEVFECPQMHMRYQAEWLMNEDLLRFALAEARVRADLKLDRSTNFSDRAPLSHYEMEPKVTLARRLQLTESKRQPLLDKAYDQKRALFWLAYYGECVVRRDPANSRDLLLSKSGTTAEDSAIHSISPSLSACLPDGQKLSFTRQILKGTMAVNYYRLAMAKPMASAGAAY